MNITTARTEIYGFLGRAAGLSVSCCPAVKHDHHCDGGITTIKSACSWYVLHAALCLGYSMKNGAVEINNFGLLLSKTEQKQFSTSEMLCQHSSLR
jgi:hypothetical protein